MGKREKFWNIFYSGIEKYADVIYYNIEGFFKNEKPL